MNNYYLYGGIALGVIIAAFALILLIRWRRRENERYLPEEDTVYRRRSSGVDEAFEDSIDSYGGLGNAAVSNHEDSRLLEELKQRTEALEAYVYRLGEEADTRLNEFAEYMEQREARAEEALDRLQAMLEERLPATTEYSRFLQIPKDEQKPRSKPLRSIDTGKFLNEAAPVKVQPRNANSEKNSKVRRLHRQGYSPEQIAQELGVSTGEVRLIIELDASANEN